MSNYVLAADKTLGTAESDCFKEDFDWKESSAVAGLPRYPSVRH